jgi:hypothetical protein
MNEITIANYYVKENLKMIPLKLISLPNPPVIGVPPYRLILATLGVTIYSELCPKGIRK